MNAVLLLLFVIRNRPDDAEIESLAALDRNWTPEGCKACRESVDGKHGPPLIKLMQSTSQDAILYRCEKCGTCWLSTEGETEVIPEDDARLDFPEAFSDDRPGGDNYES